MFPKKPIGVLILHGFSSSLDCVRAVDGPLKALGLPGAMGSVSCTMGAIRMMLSVCLLRSAASVRATRLPMLSPMIMMLSTSSNRSFMADSASATQSCQVTPRNAAGEAAP